MTYSILFLDDEEELGLPLLGILEREGYQVDYFQFGEEAVEAGQSKQYDLLLLDIMLKNYNAPAHSAITSGIEVARLINQVRPTPFIFLSGRSDTYDMVAGLEMGAAHYIAKPYDLPLLLATLRAFFRERKRTILPRESSNELEIAVGDIRINLVNRQVFVKGKEVSIQEKPLAILVYLARHPNKPITKEELKKEVWGNSSDNANVEVNISRLRSSIGNQYIQTVRGGGYYLMTEKA